MASSILDAQRLREILHYDADTGLFTWKVMLAHRRKPGSVAGSRTHGYIEIGMQGIETPSATDNLEGAPAP